MHHFRDKFSRTIRLTDERKLHIETDHPELQNPVDKIEETLLFPSAVIKSMDDEYTWLYYRPAKFENQKSFLLVIVKVSNGEGFVITAFYVKNMQKGDYIWKA